MIVLPNGNIAVTDPFDSSVVAGGGAVHLFDPVAQTVIASIYGDNANDNLGSAGLTRLSNGNYVITSPLDDNGGITDAGSVRLVNGTTGAEIAVIQGDEANDTLGLGSAIELPNGNFVVGSPFDNPAGLADAGTVQLVNGVSGAVIATVAGDDASDGLGAGLIIGLDNNNVVIQSSTDTNAGILLAGSVRLIDGATGTQLGTTVYGTTAFDALGGGDFAELSNSNYVITSPLEDSGGITNAGTIRVFDGATGLQIGATIAGDVAEDQLGLGIVEPLSNNNFVVTSLLDDEGGINNAGSARLVNGLTGAEIVTIAGTSADEQLGFVTPLTNGNFVLASPFADILPADNEGTVRLFNGVTGAQIGPTAQGDVANDQLGFGSTLALINGNYVVTSVADDEVGVVDAGSARLFDGTTGTEISVYAGDTMTDSVGLGTLVALQNNNYVVGSPFEDEGVVDAGTARLFNGTTGAQIAVLAGDTPGDQIGDAEIFSLSNSNYLVISTNDDEGGVTDAGSVRLVNGTTGAQIGATLAGLSTDDVNEWIIGATQGVDYFVIGLERYDNNGLVDSGYVYLNAE